MENLQEAAPVLHLDHSEDMLFLYGTTGLRDAINFLRGTRDMLASNTSGKFDTSTKLDGAPAVWAGINPDNGKFFVGTKSIFNKTPKINYTNKDIDDNHGHAPALAEKLKIALKYLPALGIKNILQGDMMFSTGDLKKAKIGSEKYITFHPNTIVYAVPANSNLSKMIQMAKMGIVFHTTYTGKSMDSLSASFGANVKNLRQTPNVWFQNANIPDLAGTVTMTSAETKVATSILSSVGKNFRKLDSGLFNKIADGHPVKMHILTYINSLIRANSSKGPTVAGLSAYVKKKFADDAAKLKTEKAQKKKIAAGNEILKLINSNKKQLTLAFSIHTDLTAVKNILIKKLESIENQHMRTFVKDSSGYRVVAPEGFVVASHEKGNAVKLVSRLEFSANNFNTDLKAWSK